jgi:plastocyanin
MRKLLVLIGCLAAASLVIPAGASASVAARKKAPVKLSGKVNNHGTKTVKGTSIEVEQDDYYFGPTFIKAKPGTTLTINLKNEGTEAHNFSIDDQHIDQTVDPDGKATVTVTVPATGIVNFYCKFHLTTNGMQGAIFTKAGGTAAAKANSTTSGNG